MLSRFHFLLIAQNEEPILPLMMDQIFQDFDYRAYSLSLYGLHLRSRTLLEKKPPKAHVVLESFIAQKSILHLHKRYGRQRGHLQDQRQCHLLPII